jgi:hypothetical protein
MVNEFWFHVISLDSNIKKYKFSQIYQFEDKLMLEYEKFRFYIKINIIKCVWYYNVF